MSSDDIFLNTILVLTACCMYTACFIPTKINEAELQCCFPAWQSSLYYVSLNLSVILIRAIQCKLYMINRNFELWSNLEVFQHNWITRLTLLLLCGWTHSCDT